MINALPFPGDSFCTLSVLQTVKYTISISYRHNITGLYIQNQLTDLVGERSTVAAQRGSVVRNVQVDIGIKTDAVVGRWGMIRPPC